MPSVVFGSNFDVKNYPQAERLGLNMIQTLFDGCLSDLELLMLEKGFDEVGLDNTLSLEEKKRLLICALCSSLVYSIESDVVSIARSIPGISNKTLAEIFLFSDDSRYVEDFLSVLNKAELSEIALSHQKFYLKELVRRNLRYSMESLLNQLLEKGCVISDVFRASGGQTMIQGVEMEDNGAVIEQQAFDVDMIRLIKADNYAVIQSAARINSCLVIEYLLSQLSDVDKYKAIKANGFFSINVAIENFELPLLKGLFAQLSETWKVNAIKAFDYEIFQYAAGKGNLEAIKYFESLLSETDKVSAIRAGVYGAIRSATGMGFLDVSEHLEAQLLGKDKINARKIMYGAVISLRGNRMALINRLDLQVDSESKYQSIRNSDLLPYRLAANSGNLALIEYFEAQLSDADIMYAIRYCNYDVIRQAASRNHLAVIEHFMQHNFVFSYIEMHSAENSIDYRQYLTPYIEEQLRLLETARLNFEEASPNGVFDIASEDVEKYFIVLRHLLRRNNSDDIASINQLVVIPSIHQRLHCGFVDRVALRGSPAFIGLEEAGSAENQLLIVARDSGNRDAMRLLLAVPEVRRRAEAANYYQADTGTLLAEIARDRESSMRALTPAQKITFNKLRNHYQASLQRAGGIDGVFNELMATLKARYELKPAQITLGDKTYDLPLTFDALQAFKLENHLSDALYQQALESYHQHQDHTVLRYLSKPNLWLDERASYVYINDEHTERWSTFEDYKTEIIYFYLAAKDEAMPCSDDSAVSDRVDLFLRQLALIGRAHNWDKKTSQGQEYDDIREGDKPSCYRGVNRRLYQSVLNHPLVVPFEEVLVQEIRNLVRADYQSRLNELSVSELTQLEKDIDEAFIDVSADGATFNSIKAFDLSKETQKQFSDEMIQKWGNNVAAFIRAKVTERFSLNNTFSTHLSRFYGEVTFGEMLSSTVSQLDEKKKDAVEVDVMPLENIEESLMMSDGLEWEESKSDSGEDRALILNPIDEAAISHDVGDMNEAWVAGVTSQPRVNDKDEPPEWLNFLFASINRPEMLLACLVIGVSMLALTPGLALGTVGASLVAASVVGLGFRFFSASMQSDVSKVENDAYEQPQAMM